MFIRQCDYMNCGKPRQMCPVSWASMDSTGAKQCTDDPVLKNCMRPMSFWKEGTYSCHNPRNQYELVDVTWGDCRDLLDPKPMP